MNINYQLICSHIQLLNVYLSACLILIYMQNDNIIISSSCILLLMCFMYSFIFFLSQIIFLSMPLYILKQFVLSMLCTFLVYSLTFYTIYFLIFSTFSNILYPICFLIFFINLLYKSSFLVWSLVCLLVAYINIPKNTAARIIPAG